jgi:hypothetical protein
MSDYCARRVFAEKVVALPALRRSDESWNEAAAAIRTDIAHHMIDTGGAEHTFIGADAHVT